MTEKESPSSKSLLTVFADELIKLQEFIELVKAGYESGIMAVESFDLLETSPRDYFEDMSEETKKEVRKQREKLASSAKQEFDLGFPYPHGLATIRLWSILEAMVDDVALCLIKKNPESLNHEKVQRIKGPLILFSKLSSDDQAIFILEKLKSETDSQLKLGMGQITSVLEPLGLSWVIHEEISKCTFELQQTRHVLVHRNGKADSRFCDRCPWLGYSIGDEVKISEIQFERYYTLIFWFLWEFEKGLFYDPKGLFYEPSDERCRNVEERYIRVSEIQGEFLDKISELKKNSS